MLKWVACSKLEKRLQKSTDVKGPVARHLRMPLVDAEKPINSEYLYTRFAKFFRLDDIIISDASTSFFGLLPIILPTGAKFESQMLWGAIGWATPATLGITMAAPNRRVVLITGEGSHQMTAQESVSFTAMI